MTQVGYRVVLPPGWTRIPLRDSPSAAIDEILDHSFHDLPMDKYGPYRSELRKKLLAQVDAARHNEGVDLYLPVERVHGATIAASFVVALLEFDSVETPEAQDVLVAFAAASDGPGIADVDGSPAVRTESVVVAVPDAEDETRYGSRRVTYLVSIPNGLDRWLTVSFSTVGDGTPDGEVAGLLVDLFDAIMSTFRWALHD